MFVIHKASRLPNVSSYSGPTWDAAGIRDQYQTQFSDRSLAESLARKLSDFNGVGFTVSKVV